jgi:hypothetical protein
MNGLAKVFGHEAKAKPIDGGMQNGYGAIEGITDHCSA